MTKVGQHRIGSIRVLRTGTWTFIGFDYFACGFRFWSNSFFLRFCGCGWFFFTALKFVIDPLILPYSGVPHGFLLCSLSKITDLPFRSVPCLKLEQASFSYFFWNCMWNSFNFLFLIFFLIFLNKCCCLSHFTLEFGTESEGNVGWKLRCLCQTAWSCLCLHYHVFTF